MISFDFKYFKASSLTNAVELYQQNSQSLYYAGGTEIITFARRNELYTQAVIDIKEIPECQTLEYQNDWLVIGSTLTLNEIIDANPFPLLTQSCHHVADHTNRNKISLGGNLCGRINYREALLPFLLTDAHVMIMGQDGLRQTSIHEFYDHSIKLAPGEFLVQLAVKREDTLASFVFIKRTKLEHIDYPLVTVAALKRNGRICVAFSGVCRFPFRSQAIENVLNDHGIPIEERINRTLTLLPDAIIDDILGSSEYRAFVLSDVLYEALSQLGEVS